MTQMFAASAIVLLQTCFVVGAAQGVSRILAFDNEVSISERLLSADVAVVVRKAPTTPLIGGSPETNTLEDEIVRLSKYGAIAVVRVEGKHGEVVDGGTWIRTRIRGRSIHVVKLGPSLDHNGFVEFWEDGGSTNIGSVRVTAEPYTVFDEHRDYLLFLLEDSRRGTAYAGFAFAVGSDGVLKALRRSDGNVAFASSNLPGRNINEIAKLLRQSQ